MDRRGYNTRKGLKDSPSQAAEKAREILKADKSRKKAFDMIYNSIAGRHRSQFDETFEDAMKLYIDIGVGILESCKEGLIEYRKIVQQNRSESLQKILEYYISCVEKRSSKIISQYKQEIKEKHKLSKEEIEVKCKDWNFDSEEKMCGRCLPWTFFFVFDKERVLSHFAYFCLVVRFTFFPNGIEIRT